MLMWNIEIDRTTIYGLNRNDLRLSTYNRKVTKKKQTIYSQNTS